MICASLYYQNDLLWRFKIEGHSGYSSHGSDIICAAVSILTFNTVNAITELSDEETSIKQIDNSKGLLDCEFPKRKLGSYSEGSQILLDAMILGLNTIKETYGENYIQIQTIRR